MLSLIKVSIKIKMREQPRRRIGKITEFQIVVKCFLFFCRRRNEYESGDFIT